MRLIRYGAEFGEQSRREDETLSTVATIGNFDGVHRGHQAVIQTLKSIAKKIELPVTVITFEPTPLEFFLKERAPKRLTPFREKYTLLKALAVDIKCVLRFNASLSQLSAEDFIQIILVKKLGIKHLIIGEDFRFGKNRTGDVELLRVQGEMLGFQVTAAPLMLDAGYKISSSRIREALAQNRVDEAEKWLGRKVEYNE